MSREAKAPAKVPAEWKDLDLARMTGTTLILGERDTGKSSFAEWLAKGLAAEHGRIAWLDLDVGQSSLGLPGTLNLAIVEGRTTKAPEPSVSFFVGGVTPPGHMLQILVGARKLADRGAISGARALVIDTDGMTQAGSGAALKNWEIELFSPEHIVAFVRGSELDHLLGPLEQDSRFQVHRFAPLGEAVGRTKKTRARKREIRFETYLEKAAELRLHRERMAVYDAERIETGTVIAFQDRDGFVVALGVVSRATRDLMVVRTPARDLERVTSIRAGSMKLDRSLSGY